jgi:hypothetical protein
MTFGTSTPIIHKDDALLVHRIDGLLLIRTHACCSERVPLKVGPFPKLARLRKCLLNTQANSGERPKSKSSRAGRA